MSTNDPTDPTAAPLPESWKADETEALDGGKKHRKLWWIVGVLVVVVVAIAAFAVATNGGLKPERAWPDEASGRPTGLGEEKQTAGEVEPAADQGVYIWNSFDGWHLWVVNGPDLAGLTGTITSSDDFVRATSSAPAAGTVAIDGKELTFDLSADAAVAGVDFEPGFSRKLTFDLQTADGPVPVKLIKTGSGMASVDANPVVIDKPVVKG